jgi:hypothetical protein
MRTQVNPRNSIGTLAERPAYNDPNLPLGWVYGATDAPGGFTCYILDPVAGWQRMAPAVTSTASLMKFSGAVAGDAALTVTRYWADEGAVADSSPDPVNYPSLLLQTAIAISVQIDSNSLVSSTVLELTKNGTPTGLSIAINGLVTGQLTATGSVDFLTTDTFGLVAVNIAGGAGNLLRGAAMVQFTPTV